MKKIKNLRDLELEEIKLKLKVEILSKEIEHKWHAIKEKWNPMNIAGEFIAEKITGGKEMTEVAKVLLGIGKKIFSKNKSE